MANQENKKKTRWEIPEIIERDLLRPVAEDFLNRSAHIFPCSIDEVEIDCIASTDRSDNGQDIINFIYPMVNADGSVETDEDGLPLCETLEIVIAPASDPEQIIRELKEGNGGI
jgi:hypothetical protein